MHPRKLTFVATGFGVAILTLFMISWTGYRTTQRLVAALQWRSHTDQVIDEINTVIARMTEAEADSHRFVLTTDTQFLDPYQPAIHEARSHLVTLRTLTADNPSQQKRLDRLEPLTDEKVEFMDRINALARRGAVKAAAVLVDTGQGRKLMNDIRTLMEEMWAEEKALLVQRDQAIRASTDRVNMTLLGGAVFSVAMLVGIFVALDREVLERRKAEEERRTSESRLRAILDNSPASIYLKDLDGRFVLVNHRIETILHRTREEIVGKTSRALFPEEVADRLAANDRRVLESGESLTIEETVPMPDGLKTYLLTRFPLRDSEGRIYALGGISTDITERKRAEDEVSRTQTFLDSVVENIPNMVFIKEAEDLRFVRLNRAGEQLLGFPRSDLIGKNDHDFFPKEQADFFVAKDRDVLRRGELVDIPEEPVRTRAGEERFLHTKKVPILDPSGQPLYLLGISEDITERKAAQEEIVRLNRDLTQHSAQLETVNGELEAFSYSVSHDLRAPLRHVHGFVDLLRSHAGPNLDEKGRKYLETIATASRRMGNLIDDLLVFSRMGRTEMRKTRVALGPLVAEVIRELESDLKGRTIEWQIAPLPQVEGDPAMLRQVLANLVGNAVKYTGTRPQARIEIGARESDGESIVYVRDNGVGFDMKYSDKLFGVFQRLHKSDEFEGTGIGLANVRRIVHRHGGRTWGEGEIERGAAFYFSLPKEREAA